MKNTDAIRQATDRFVNLLIHLGFTPNDILEGMDDALDKFEEAIQNLQV